MRPALLTAAAALLRSSNAFTSFRIKSVHGAAAANVYARQAYPSITMPRRSLRLSASSSASAATGTSVSSDNSSTSRSGRKSNANSAGSNKRKASTSSAAMLKTTSNDNDNDDPLLDLGKLLEAEVIKRPSSTIKSPYVADCRLADATADDPLALAHAPALDVGGLCSPGATVLLKERPPGGKTSHSIEIVTAAAPDGEEGAVLVGAHPRLGEELAEEVLRRGLLQDVIGFAGAVDSPLSSKKKSPKKAKKKPKAEDDEEEDASASLKPGVYLKKQVTYGDSQVDFELEEVTTFPSEGRKALIEVKNIVCADYFSAHAPEKKDKNHCVIVSSEEKALEYKRTALFPWGRLGQEFEGRKVVSARAIKHIRNLVDVAKKTDIQPVVLFVVNRSDCDTVRSCHEQCPVFAEELAKAQKNGVIVTAFRIRWSRDGKASFDGVVPVSL